MTGRIAICLLLLLPMYASAQSADAKPGDIDPADVVVRMPGMPDRGTTMETVRARLGEPARRVGPVGDPPITRWVYDRFTVYFEHDRVLHAVKNRNR